MNKDLVDSANYIAPLTVDLGVVRQFGDLDIGIAGLKSGWALPEASHNWSDGYEAVLECTAPSFIDGCWLEFAGEPFFCEGIPNQDMYLYVNGFRVGFWRINSSGEHTLKAYIEPEQIFRRGGHATLKCIWFFPNAVRPIDKGLNADTRELAFCFRSIAVLKA